MVTGLDEIKNIGELMRLAVWGRDMRGEVGGPQTITIGSLALQGSLSLEDFTNSRLVLAYLVQSGLRILKKRDSK